MPTVPQRMASGLSCRRSSPNSFEAIRHGFATLERHATRTPSCATRIPGFHLEGPYLSGEDGPRGATPGSTSATRTGTSSGAGRTRPAGGSGWSRSRRNEPGRMRVHREARGRRRGRRDRPHRRDGRADSRRGEGRGEDQHAPRQRLATPCCRGTTTTSGNNSPERRPVGEHHRRRPPSAARGGEVHRAGEGRVAHASDVRRRAASRGCRRASTASGARTWKCCRRARSSSRERRSWPAAATSRTCASANVMRFAGVTLAEAVEMATSRPRQLLGLPVPTHRSGSARGAGGVRVGAGRRCVKIRASA